MGRDDLAALVTGEDLAAAAAAYIEPERVVWVIVGDWEAIRTQLAELDLGPVELLERQGS